MHNALNAMSVTPSTIRTAFKAFNALLSISQCQCLSVSFSESVSQCQCLSVSVSVSVFIFQCFSVGVSVSVSQNLSVSISILVSHNLSVSVSILVSPVFQCLSVSV